ncbi:MAG: hypothetical protein ACRDYA_09095 [Egibacteraceae bacterium]
MALFPHLLGLAEKAFGATVRRGRVVAETIHLRCGDERGVRVARPSVNAAVDASGGVPITPHQHAEAAQEAAGAAAKLDRGMEERSFEITVRMAARTPPWSAARAAVPHPSRGMDGRTVRAEVPKMRKRRSLRCGPGLGDRSDDPHVWHAEHMDVAGLTYTRDA